MDETKAVANLPNLNIEITHRRHPEEGAEFMSITLRATPSFGAVSDYLDTYNPMLAFFSPLPWMRMMQAMWQPWLPAPARSGSSKQTLIPPQGSGDNRR
jgi:hypothetical protein